MPILEQYFKTFHHLPPPSAPSSTAPIQAPLDFLSILFCVNERNLPLFTQCQSFIDILHTFALPYQSPIQNTNLLDSILDLQAHILTENPHILESLLPYFAKLNLASVINDDELAQFVALKNAASHLHNAISQTPKTAIAKDTKALREAFYTIYESLLPLLPNAQDTLAQIKAKLEEQHLCIGVTGVLSAGKSTFLNALLGEEILGSSNIPETANLTILRYGDKTSAKVYFWSKEQWADLCEEGEYDEHLKVFVAECKAHFGKELERYITQPHTSQEIQAQQLSAYTSANHPSKLCNLIQEVELFTPLDFLKNGVEIVDTPGLDDPITKREDITRAYMQRCDMLIHVMNASCAATQKDIDFILESLLEQNISRLLVVLTRIDLLSKDELNASLEYTKSSLITQLKNANYKGDIAQIISRIDFIPLAGYAALLHRTATATSDINITLEQSGILDIELYLQKMLLGEDSLKARDMLYLAYKALHKIAQESAEAISLKTALLNANKADLEKIIAKEKAHNETLLRELVSLESQFNALYDELKNFLHALHSLSANTLSKVATILRDKIFDDMMYDYGRGARIESSALHKMIELSLKDCFADIGREYRYKLSKKITQLKDAIAATEEPTLPPIHFQLKNAEIAPIMQPLLNDITALIKSAKKDQSLKNALEALFNTLFSSFATLIESKNKEINTLFMAHFDEIAQYQKTLIHTKIAQKEQSLQTALAQHDKGDTQEQKQALDAQYKQLKALIDKIENALGYLH
ncbi:dynamin family protein [uncultured Helicobacter sp.]|uniref:dynamin family protein n=1 Tax=uncultured Helicobacter sp. TaxID=175537 RepID=UPI0026354042|nr:dynamin family protein [uncultured Helicobacter sp.]